MLSAARRALLALAIPAALAAQRGGPTVVRTNSVILTTANGPNQRVLILPTLGQLQCSAHFSTSTNAVIEYAFQVSSDSGRSWFETPFWDGNEITLLTTQAYTGAFTAPLDATAPLQGGQAGTGGMCALDIVEMGAGVDTVYLQAAPIPTPFANVAMGSCFSWADPANGGRQKAGPGICNLGGRDSLDSARQVWVTNFTGARILDQALETSLNGQQSFPQNITDTMSCVLGAYAAADSVVIPAYGTNTLVFVQSLDLSLTDTAAITGSKVSDTLTSSNFPGGGTIMLFGNAATVGATGPVNGPWTKTWAPMIAVLATNTATKFRISPPGTGGKWNLCVSYTHQAE